MEIWLKKEKRLVLQLELFEDNDDLIRAFICHCNQLEGGEKYAQSKNKKRFPRSQKIRAKFDCST